MIRLPEDDVSASKHVGLLTMYIYMLGTFVGLDNDIHQNSITCLKTVIEAHYLKLLLQLSTQL